jgi:hypothetical protein
MRKFVQRPTFFALLLALSTFLGAASAAGAAPGLCPAIHRPIPSAAERQHLQPIDVMRCFMSLEEIEIVESAIGHDPQTTVTDPAFDSGELNPDGTTRPPLTSAQIAELARMHSILDSDMHAGAIIRKYVPNSDVGGFLYGRTVITSNGKPLVVSTNTVRGFVGLERNTQGLDAGATLAAVGLDYETTPLGQFTDSAGFSYYREVAIEVLAHGMHAIRHIMSAQGASDAKIPLGKDLNDAIQGNVPSLSGRSFEMNRQGQVNPYTALGISDEIALLTLSDHDGLAMYRLHLNEEDVMTTPTPLAVGDTMIRRLADGREMVVAIYQAVKNADGTTTNRWVLARNLPHNLAVYYNGLVQQAAQRVAAAGG